MNTCPNCGKATGFHSSIMQGCTCQYSMQAKITIPKEDMMRIKENIKRYMLMGVSEEETKKYFYDCVMAYRNKETNEPTGERQ